MRGERLTRLGLGLLLLSGCLEKKQPASAPQEPAPLSASERRGRLLYQRGVSADGRELVGFVGEERVAMSGEATACARCHGRTGAGTTEGGIGAPSLRADALISVRGRYDEASLQHAIRTGVAFNGRRLAAAMPRFGLSDADLGDLLAYLRRLGNEPIPGVRPDRVRVGTALPLTGSGAAAGRAVRAVLEARIAELNAGGGLLRRRLELHVEDAARAGAAERLAAMDLLAVVAPVLPDDLDGLGALAAAGVPVLGPLSSPRDETRSGSGPVFFLFPGAELEGKVLVTHAIAGGLLRLLLVAGKADESRRWLAAVEEELGRAGLAPLGRLPLELEEVRGAVAEKKPQAILVHGSAAEVGRVASVTGELPVFATSQALPSAPRAPSLRVSHAGPISGTELGSLARLARGTALSREHRGAQHGALLALELLEETLLRSGRELSRDRLLEVLESLSVWKTRDGFTVSFGPNRRIGIEAARVVRATPEGQLVPVTGWIEPAP